LVHFECEEIRPGDLATLRIESAKPHFIFGARDSVKVLTTRGGDAFAARKAEAEQTGTFLGVPRLKSVLNK
jgi:hypothetical protein